ncbi:response regulator transcription factor [Chloroflexi bacterium TSY]|nr:response regulator transcription factor [Chloroflexi bacterium TSY]
MNILERDPLDQVAVKEKSLEKNIIRVLIVDDHTVVRDGLEFILKTTDDIQVVATASNGERGLLMCNQHQPDVVLMDLVMPEMDGITAIKKIHERYPAIQIVALTSFHEEELVQQALQAGAISYLLKNVEACDLANAIRSAYSGRSTLAPEAAQALVQTVSQPKGVGHDLTLREQEVLNHLVDGLTNVEIAEQMTVSRNTIRHHIRNILSKLSAVNRTEAVSIAMQRNLVVRARRT